MIRSLIAPETIDAPHHSGYSLLEMMVVTGIMSITLVGTMSMMQSVTKSQTKSLALSTRTQLITRLSNLLNDQNVLLISAGFDEGNSPALFGCIANSRSSCPQGYRTAAMASNHQSVCVPDTPSCTEGTSTIYSKCSDCGLVTNKSSCKGWIYGPQTYLASSEKAYCIWKNPAYGSEGCVVLTTNALTTSDMQSNCPLTWTSFSLRDQNAILVQEYYSASGGASSPVPSSSPSPTPSPAASSNPASINPYAFKFTPYFKGSSASNNSIIYLYFTLEAGPAAKALGIQDYTSPTLSLPTPLSPIAPTGADMCGAIGGKADGANCSINSIQ